MKLKTCASPWLTKPEGGCPMLKGIKVPETEGDLVATLCPGCGVHFTDDAPESPA